MAALVADCIVLPWSCNSSIVFTKLCARIVYALVESTEISKLSLIPKIYFRNPVYSLISENFSFRKFPAIRYTPLFDWDISNIRQGLPVEQYSIVTEDSVDCSISLLQKVKQQMAKHSEDSTHTPVLENVITVKLKLAVVCKVILRHNIDVTLGFVNEAIGTIRDIQRCIDHANKVHALSCSVTIKSIVERVTAKFEVLDKAYVICFQVPITTVYAITIHKSQGLTLSQVLTDIGNTIFTCSQTYVALSRVKSIESLHLVNFDPRLMKALDSAVLEYNQLRIEFMSNLQPFILPKQHVQVVGDRLWCTIKHASVIQEPINQSPKETTFKGRGFANTDGVSSYANSVVQCLMLFPAVRQGWNPAGQQYSSQRHMCCIYINS